jgi:7-cyano-7-deazaguanine reductase
LDRRLSSARKQLLRTDSAGALAVHEETAMNHADNDDPSATIETFENSRPERDYLIVHTCHEFTSVCPKTGQPDFGTIVVEYVPNLLCLELKSLKFYFQSYRQQGIFYEAVTNKILDDLVGACLPRRMRVVGNFNVRGGFSSVITADYPGEPAASS